MNSYLREIPPIHELQQDPRFQSLLEEAPFGQVTKSLKEAVDQIRKEILTGDWDQQKHQYLKERLFAEVETKVNELSRYHLQRVINGTGTILHTNLGRARLSEEAIRQVNLTAANYSNLEYNIQKGSRGSRHDVIESILTEVTGAEAAIVVNNNAAAVYLILKALASDQEVIVSRGQLVEIGGSFRVSSIMEESGAKLVEVGTTNKTHLYDYEQAITEDTAMIMKVHTSNFKTIGFTESVDIEELVDVRAKHEGLILYEDLGSGALYDFRKHHIGEEPTVAEVLSKGVDLVSFSGDKLLGGPQAGIIAGKKELIKRLAKHQLARVLRVDKMTLAALEATLKAYVYGEEALNRIPVVRAVLTSETELKERTQRFVDQLDQKVWQWQLEKGTSQVGGGTMPDVELPSVLVHLRHPSLSAQQLFDRLRLGEPAIICRLKDDDLVIDLRTTTEEEVQIVVQALDQINKDCLS
ncbi:L-seryl-tRNA(Sec) selenium transferase [Desertibacillus haloalkaliphilus]|uniref:L-seryl-tRNA(Sec) selenium transferase n=1 Tax=Desertibacillus haloalkaliphilus TaxID=1328930 RepID=UPI001C265971|nr:L-seryl-tRNA(Sec) selenium transferase [Desertibacillus haloalkaliphilus]MBU8907417.1 L-seryl-tRNA(Sec) selenium transferase [Desertibacillus haloalkaliphilus]